MKKKILLGIGIAAGLALIVLSGFIGNGKNDIPDQNPTKGIDISGEEYANKLEARLAEQIGRISGVSGVSVMITLENNGETVYAQNADFAEGDLISKEYLVIDAGSAESTVVVRELLPKVRGVSVVCSGGDEPVMQAKIINMVCALFGISSNRVYVSG